MADSCGFIFDVLGPTKDGFVARIVVTPNDPKGGVDTARKLERHLGQHRALGVVLELLQLCDDIPEDVIAKVEELKRAANPI